VAFLEIARVTPDVVQTASFYSVVACWFVFLVTFGLRERKPEAQETKRDQTAILGMLLEGAGYFIVWLPHLRRNQFSPVARSQAAAWALAVAAVATAATSTWLVNAASRRLGKQWAVAARLIEGHTLIQDGPYCFVRNPIYVGMFGILLATGLIQTQWIPLLVASLLFIAGTYIRIRSEERLLRAAFGSEFEAYTRNVPALIPGIY
jgi:protein-S-isoprenylcysteine O-methyltransferase Ste14